MKLSKKHLVPMTSLAGALAVLTACQVGNLPKASNDASVNSNLNGNKTVVGQNGNVQTNPNLVSQPAGNPNASVTGQLLDKDGKPVANAYVIANNGQVAKTDENGNYSIAVTAEAGKQVTLVFSKDGYVYTSSRVTMAPGDQAIVNKDIKPLDPLVNQVTAASGGTFKNSSDVLEVDVPAGALTKDAQLRMTPLDFGQGNNPNDLPGPLETVDEQGNPMLLMPVEYWSVDLQGGSLKDGQSMTMRMKLPNDPNAPVKLKAGDMIPCYIYDAKLGYWNSPNLGPIVEKDGALWATYEIKPSALTQRTDIFNRTVQHIYTGTRDNPISDDELKHNAWEAAQANSGNLLSNANNPTIISGGVNGVEGGHTYFNVYGTNMQGTVIDWDGSAISGASVSENKRGLNQVTGTNGAYSFLENRATPVTYTAQKGQASNSISGTTPSNRGALPINQFGDVPSNGLTYEQPDPKTATAGNIQLDTRHKLIIHFNGADAVDLTKCKMTLDGQDMTSLPATLLVGSRGFTVNNSAKTLTTNSRVATRAQHVFTISGDGGSGTKTFSIPASQTPASDFTVDVDVVVQPK